MPASAAAGHAFGIPRETLLQIYRKMLLIRAFEEKARELFQSGQLPRHGHLYAGQEAVAAGAIAAIHDDDFVAATHRGHGVAIARTEDLKGAMAEIDGKGVGFCGGKGGSMHIADMSKGMLGANAIVGGSPPIAVGAALTQKVKKTGKVAVAFSGDGASNQGTTFEALNMAAVLGAPAIFAFENNGYGEHTASSYAVAAPSIAERARSFGMPAEVVDGADFFAVHQAMGRALERARAGEGPYALELVCSRFLGHFVGDPQRYRTAEELAQARANDPLPRFRTGVTEAALLEDSELDEIERRVLALIDEAVVEAIAAPRPDLSSLEADVYVRY